MTAKKILRAVVILLMLAINVGCDQISKKLVREKVSYNANIKILNDHFTLTKVENKGAFLSVGNNFPPQIKLIILTIIPVIFLIIAVFYLLSKTNISRIASIAMCFMIGGGIGNIYDRIIYGSVTDFLHIDFILFQTGIFNFADVSIMVGMFLFLVEMYKTRKHNEELENI